MCRARSPDKPARYPGVADCDWSGSTPCTHQGCRYSVLGERSRLPSWDEHDYQCLLRELPSTCALDLANLGGLSLEETAVYLGMSRARVEQIELSALRKLAKVRELRRANWDGR